MKTKTPIHEVRPAAAFAGAVWKPLVTAMMAAGALSLASCATRAGTGAAAGAGTGAVLGGPPGALVGAGVGAVGGAAMDETARRR